MFQKELKKVKSLLTKEPKKKVATNPEVLISEMDNGMVKFLEECNAIIMTEADKDMSSKVDRLKNLGFTNTIHNNDLKVIAAKEKKKGMIDEINKYRLRFPGYKYVHNDVFMEVLEDYDLYTAPTEKYIGHVPDRCIKDMEKFVEFMNSSKRAKMHFLEALKLELDEIGVHYKDMRQNHIVEAVDNITIASGGYNLKFEFEGRDYFLKDINGKSPLYREYDDNGDQKAPDDLIRVGGYPVLDATIIPATSFAGTDLSISAPKDLIKLRKDGKGGLVNEKFKDRMTIIDLDPIVSYPAGDHGRIIITAWGKEAVDPRILNELSN